MKLAKFEYTDLKGKVTNREVCVVSMPSNKLSGIDVTELSEEEQAMFSAEYDLLVEEFQGKLTALKEQYGVNHNFRQFLEAGIKFLDMENI